MDDLILEPPKPEEMAQEGNETQEVIVTEETQAYEEVTVASTLAESKTHYFDGNVSLDKCSKDCSGGECALLSWIKEDPFAHITVDGYGNISGDFNRKETTGQRDSITGTEHSSDSDFDTTVKITAKLINNDQILEGSIEGESVGICSKCCSQSVVYSFTLHAQP